MASNSDLEFIWEVIETLPARKYSIRIVEIDNLIVEWTLSGKMRMNRISVMEWDYVKIELSQYEMSKWRIVYRYKNPQEAQRALNEPDTETDSEPSE